VDEKDPNKPPGILKTSSLSPVVNNWLGKTIFGSFRVGFEDAVSNEFMGEKDFFLESGYGAGGGGLENSTAGESGNGTENGYFPSGVTGVEMAAGNSGSLPRPHHTGSNSKDSGSSNAGEHRVLMHVLCVVVRWDIVRGPGAKIERRAVLARQEVVAKYLQSHTYC
jgi:hypothetical protein